MMTEPKPEFGLRSKNPEKTLTKGLKIREIRLGETVVAVVVRLVVTVVGTVGVEIRLVVVVEVVVVVVVVVGVVVVVVVVIVVLVVVVVVVLVVVVVGVVEVSLLIGDSAMILSNGLVVGRYGTFSPFWNELTKSLILPKTMLIFSS